MFHPALAGKTVTLTFGDFGGTNAAPVVLVSSGFRASGVVTRVNFYTLSIQDSTFQIVQGAAQGPQVGSQMLLDFFGSDPSVALGARQVDPTTQRPIVGGVAVISNGPVCNNAASINNVLGNGQRIPQVLGTLSSANCFTVNGSISYDLVPPRLDPDSNSFGTDGYAVTVQQGQEDLIVTLTLTHPPSASQLGDQRFGTLFDLDVADFNMRIFRQDSLGNTSFIRDCEDIRTSPEVCSVVLLSTAGIPALQIIITPFYGDGDYTLDVYASRLITNRAACGNPLAEIEPNDTLAMPQNVGTVTASSCLRISGSLSTVDVDDVDLYNLTTVGNDLLIISLTLDNPNDNRAMRLFDPNNNNQILVECAGSILPQVCALTGLQSQTRNLDLVVVSFTDSTIPQANYTLDILSAGVPPDVTPPSGETCVRVPDPFIAAGIPCPSGPAAPRRP